MSKKEEVPLAAKQLMDEVLNAPLPPNGEAWRAYVNAIKAEWAIGMKEATKVFDKVQREDFEQAEKQGTIEELLAKARKHPRALYLRTLERASTLAPNNLVLAALFAFSKSNE